MRIERRKDVRAVDDSFNEALREVIHGEAHGEARDGRPCGTLCTTKCPVCGATDCRCACSRTCANIPLMLSSEPDMLPLEAKIAPLVYEMNRLGFFRPCWSCEGHMGKDGTLWKTPRVWFYSASQVHVRLLAESLQELRIQKRLKVPWRVGVTFSDEGNLDTTYALEPDMGLLSNAGLDALQNDVAVIAEHLGTVIKEQARKLSRGAGAR